MDDQRHIGAIDAIHKAMTHPGAVVVPLSERQFLWGLRYIHFRRSIQSTQELLDQQMYPIASADLVDDMKLFLHFASAVYSSKVAQVEDSLRKQECTQAFTVVSSQLSNSMNVPAHFLALSNYGGNSGGGGGGDDNQSASTERKICVLAIRGATDIKTAIAHALRDVQEVSPGELPYRAHGLMVEAAASLVAALEEVLKVHSLHGFQVITTGHSLGGAVAALTAVLLRSKGIEAEAYTYGTPACVELALAQECSEYVTSIVCGDDLVPRLSAYNTAELSHRLATLPWRKILISEQVWWEDMIRREQLQDLERAQLTKELCLCAENKTISEDFTTWMRSSGHDMLHLLPPGRICYLAQTSSATVPMVLHAHDQVMVRESPMCLQVSESCVPHHALSAYLQCLTKIQVAGIPTITRPVKQQNLYSMACLSVGCEGERGQGDGPDEPGCFIH